jgi:hypothetical protein
MITMPVLAKTIVLLTLSNVFMTFAWYAHLKELNQKPWIIAALLSWGVALFEYLRQPDRVHALRCGPAQDHAGSDCPVGVRPILGVLPAPAVAAQLSVGRMLPDGRGVFHVQGRVRSEERREKREERREKRQAATEFS